MDPDNRIREPTAAHTTADAAYDLPCMPPHNYNYGCHYYYCYYCYRCHYYCYYYYYYYYHHYHKLNDKLRG